VSASLESESGQEPLQEKYKHKPLSPVRQTKDIPPPPSYQTQEGCHEQIPHKYTDRTSHAPTRRYMPTSPEDSRIKVTSETIPASWDRSRDVAPPPTWKPFSLPASLPQKPVAALGDLCEDGHLRDKVSYRSVALTGNVLVCDHFGSLAKAASVDFEHKENQGNPIVTYLQRHAPWLRQQSQLCPVQQLLPPSCLPSTGKTASRLLLALQTRTGTSSITMLMVRVILSESLFSPNPHKSAAANIVTEDHPRDHHHTGTSLSTLYHDTGLTHATFPTYVSGTTASSPSLVTRTSSVVLHPHHRMQTLSPQRMRYPLTSNIQVS
jgi:hypothetical protein